MTDKAVLISLRPKWCELMAIFKKKAEIRKTKPNLETPFKCYIYQTHRTWVYKLFPFLADYQGKVIGEFVCNKIDYWQYNYMAGVLHIADMSILSCISIDGLLEYLGHRFDANGYDKRLYAWHISDLVIYDKPKELSEFSKYGFSHPVPLKRPPQSWCYVEVLKCA